MAAWVNIFAHGALRRIAVNGASGQLGVDSVMSVDAPLNRQNFPAVDVVAQTANSDLAPVGTEVIWYEVQAGKIIGYERANANATLRTADASSPTLEGKGYLSFSYGSKLSLIDRTATG